MVIKTLGPGFEPPPPALSPHEVAASVSVCVYSNPFTKQMFKVVPLVSTPFLSEDLLQQTS